VQGAVEEQEGRCGCDAGVGNTRHSWRWTVKDCQGSREPLSIVPAPVRFIHQAVLADVAEQGALYRDVAMSLPAEASKAVKVTGVFGYSTAVPEDVVMAVKIQVMRWFMRAKSGFEDTAAAASVGQMFYTQELDPDIKLILQHYRVIATAV